MLIAKEGFRQCRLSLAHKGRGFPLLTAVVFVLTTVLFAYTVHERSRWFGDLAEGGMQWLTGSTVKFVDNWREEGALKLRFCMFENPRSIEFPDLASREPYLSYPPGTVLPVYALSKAFPAVEVHRLVMGYDLANHLAIALTLVATVSILLFQLGLSWSVALPFCMAPAVLELLTPSPLYWHQNVFFSDQAVILPVALVFLLDAIRPTVTSSRSARGLGIVEFVLGFLGALIDWLFIFVWLAACCKALAERRWGHRWVRGCLRFWLGPSLALCSLGLQVAWLGRTKFLVDKFLFRTALSAPGKAHANAFFIDFWEHYIRNAYGVVGMWGLLLLPVLLLLSAWVILRLRRGVDSEASGIRMAAFALLIAAPMYLQVYAFRNHSAVHPFSALKFSIVVALIPFVAFPLLVLSVIQTARRQDTSRRVLHFVGWICFAAALVFALALHPRYRNYFPDPSPTLNEIGSGLRGNIAYEDVVFSPHVEAADNPPELLSYTRKRIYRVTAPVEIEEKMKTIDARARVVLLFQKEPDKNWTDVVKGWEQIRTQPPLLYRNRCPGFAPCAPERL